MTCATISLISCESSVSHTIEIVVIDTASLFNNDLGEIDRCSIFAVLDLSFQGVDDLSVRKRPPRLQK